MSKKMQSNILLLITAMIWGSAFVAQKNGMDYVGALTFGGIRTFMGGLVLIPVILIMNKGKEPLFSKERREENKAILIGGICCGAALFIASTLQQFGVAHTTAGKAGFITTLYVAFVPIISVILRKRVRNIMWLCVLLGIGGMYLLSVKPGEFSISFGDALVLCCALGFAIHIMVISHFSPKMDGIKLSCVQFLFAGTLGIIGMFIFEEPDIKNILDCTIPLLYAGVLSCGIGYTLQIVAQKHAEPTVASLLMSLESVFSVIFGWLLLNELLTLREIIGCVVIFAAVIISNIPEKTPELMNQ